MVLNNIKVLDFTRFISGSFCTMILANLGAEVIKIESLSGDALRNTGNLNESEINHSFLYLNKNKKSITLDLNCEHARQTVRNHFIDTDIIVENFRPGVMTKFGLDYKHANEINEKIIYASITGFSKGSPRENEPAFDAIIQAISGLMFLNGTSEMPPLRTEIPISDIASGLYAVIGILGAMINRNKNGTGSEVQVAMLDSLMSFFAFSVGNFFSNGANPPRNGNNHPNFSPYGLYETSDDPIYIAPATTKQWISLCDCLSMKYLVSEPLFLSNQKRIENRNTLNKIIGEQLKNNNRAFWLQILKNHDIPCEGINTLSEGIEELKKNNPDMVINVDYNNQRYQTLGSPLKISSSARPEKFYCSLLGANNKELI